MRHLFRVLLASALLTGCAASPPPLVEPDLCAEHDPVRKDGGIGGTGNAKCPAEDDVFD